MKFTVKSVAQTEIAGYHRCEMTKYFMHQYFKNIFLPLVALSCLMPGVAIAETSILKSPNSPNVTMAGDNIIINDPVEGDLIVAGASVIVRADVSGDIIGAAANIDILANVAGDVRVATGNLKVDGSIKGDLIAFAGEINISDKSSIGSDTHLTSGQLTFNGIIDGYASFTVGNLLLNGSIKDSAEIVAENIEFGDNAKIAGDLKYYSKNEIVGIQKYVTGKVDYQRIDTEKARTIMGSIAAGISIFWMIAGLFTGMMLLIFLPPLPIHATGSIKQRPFISYFTGALTYLAILPIFIVLVTGIGTQLGFTFLAGWIILITYSKIFLAIVLGEWLLQALHIRPSLGARFFSLAVAIFVLATVGKLPYVTALVVLILMPLAMGAVMRSIPALFNINRQEPEFVREAIGDQMPLTTDQTLAKKVSISNKPTEKKAVRKTASKRRVTKPSSRIKK